ncbi:hypothetical protein SAMN05444413_11242 [Roseivivax marinus]|nr:hypothetical protein SAMN05444413_11242 [Roseivivax marinus]
MTGYQDFFSSLAIVMREVPEISYDDEVALRIAFGVNTGNAAHLPGRGRSISEEAKMHFLGRHGLSIEDAADLSAVLAIEAIRTGRIDLRIFDPARAGAALGISGDRRLHAKIVASPLGALAGSANFSRAGLYQNIEYVDMASANVDDPTTAAVAKDRQAAAEEIWNASTDWNTEALEILEALLRPVTTADAVARTIHEQKSFAPWCVDRQSDAAGRLPLPHQAELIYEASSITYEHGFAFVEAPTGSGKTDIGKHLGHTLGTSFERIFGQDHTGHLPRGGALAIVPPRVYPGWAARKPRVLDVVRNSRLISRRDMEIPAPEDDLLREPSAYDGAPAENTRGEADLTQYGTLIIDESHTVSPGFDETSRKAEAIEFAPPSWNVCLSATLLGNRDVDWLAHLHEKRASIFMSPGYLAEMNSLFRREASIDEMMSGATDAEALSETARAALSDMLAPFMAVRQRACIGESALRGRAGAASYPPFKIHPRPSSLSLSERQRRVMDEITRLATDLAPGRRLTSVTTSRFGNRAERRHNQNSLYARNLLNVLRANSAQALWEMEHGAIGKALRRFEVDERKKAAARAAANAAQLDLFGDLPDTSRTDAQTPSCDQLITLLSRPDIQRFDERRYSEALRIQARHRRVVFVAERIDTLEIFAAELAARREPGDEHVQYVATSDAVPAGESRRRAREDIVGGETPGFAAIRQGHLIEEFFRPGGKRNDERSASVFLTYQMAEGINLQSADALVLLGVTSNLKDLLQGMGRIDRIDSLHARTHYYLLDVPVAAIASDEKVSRRLANYRALSGRERIERAEDAGGDTQVILDSVAAYLREPRTLRSRNYHDLLSSTRALLAPERYDRIARTEIDGLWGAEIAVLEGSQAYTLLHLRGESARREQFAPPRLLLVEEDGTLIRNQVTCAQRLKAAYEEMKARGIASAPPDRARLYQALEELGARVSTIREWQLAPERTDSLLQSLAVFLSGDGGLAFTAGVDLEEQLYGELSLRGVEYLSETWARLLDPYWVRAKQQVRENFAQKAAQSYISIADMTDALQLDPENCGRIRAIMMDAITEARRIEEPSPDAISRRISVAFVSLRPRVH